MSQLLGTLHSALHHSLNQGILAATDVKCMEKPVLYSDLAL